MVIGTLIMTDVQFFQIYLSCKVGRENAFLDLLCSAGVSVSCAEENISILLVEQFNMFILRDA